MIQLVRKGMGVVVLIVGMTLQASSYDDQGSPNCRGKSQVPSPAQRAGVNRVAETPNSSDSGVVDVTRAQPDSNISSSKPHGVRLSWNASIPASKSLTDMIVGYNIYRRSSGKDYEKLNTDVIGGTSCFDDLVTPGHTYYYVTKSVSANGAISKPSQEVKAIIPAR